jgi:hypothetical protein
MWAAARLSAAAGRRDCERCILLGLPPSSERCPRVKGSSAAGQLLAKRKSLKGRPNPAFARHGRRQASLRHCGTMGAAERAGQWGSGGDAPEGSGLGSDTQGN